MALAISRRLLIAIAPVILLGFALLATSCRSAQSRPSSPTTAEALKLAVMDSGLYAVTEQQLQNAGLTFDSFTSTDLALYQGRDVIPFLIRDDRLIFYGQAPDGRYSDVRPYILRGNAQGEEIAAVQMPTPFGSTLTTIPQQLHLEENYLYASEIPSTQAGGPWFWETLRDRKEVAFDLPAVGDGAGEVRINLYGVTHNPHADPDHSLALSVNDQQVDELLWEGQTYYTSTTKLPAGSLESGENTLALDNMPEEFLDFSNLNWIEVIYPSPPIAGEDVLAFSGVTGDIELGGFSASPVILEVSQPERPTEIVGWENSGRGNIEVSVDETMSVIAAGPSGLRPPAGIEPLRNGGWRDETNQADLLIISTEALLPGVAQLVEAREAEGLAVATVPVEEIYDEFGYGEATPDSIREFIRHTQAHWVEPRPRYVLLVGEATTDYQGNLASRPDNPIERPQNIVPSYFIPVSFSGETVSDARLVDVDDDQRPDLAIGRWPVDSREEVEQLAARTLAYEAGAAEDRALFVIDDSSPEFSVLVERLLSESAFPRAQAELLNGAEADDITEEWNEGAWLVTYTGHGSLELWGKDELFSVAGVSRLNGGRSPAIVLQFTCLSGLFAHPEIGSLSESLLRYNAGPVLLVGATSLTYSFDQEPFARELLVAMQDESLERIGDVFQKAKMALPVMEREGIREVSDTFTLFGDPSARVIRPARS